MRISDWSSDVCSSDLLGAGTAPAAAQVSDDVVKLAILTDMSGPYADINGQGSVHAVQMAIEDFGGEVLGKKIELVYADHQNKADVGANAARQWFDQEQVDVVVNLANRSEEHTSELQSTMRNSYAVFCLKKKKKRHKK